jgi:hypothetical protein
MVMLQTSKFARIYSHIAHWTAQEQELHLNLFANKGSIFVPIVVAIFLSKYGLLMYEKWLVLWSENVCLGYLVG